MDLLHSNSGEADELLAITPHLKRRVTAPIAIIPSAATSPSPWPI